MSGSKCIRLNRGKKIIRCANAQADAHVWGGEAEYIPKRIWREDRDAAKKQKR